MSQQITDELRVIVEAEVERAIANFKKLDDSVEGSEKKTKSLSDAIDQIVGKAMLLSTAVAGAGIASIKFAADIESTRTSLGVLLKDGDAATKMFSDWQQLAAQTPLSGEDIADAGKKLLAFNIDAGKVTDTLRVIGDISAATGSSISEIADIYGKAAVQGRLFAEDINQFQGRGIPVVQALAKQFGVTEAAVRDLVAEGKVGFPEVEKAFAAMTGPGGQFEGMMVRLSETTMGKFSTAMDNAKMAAASFGTLMLPMANDLIDAAGDMASYFQDLDDGTKRFMIAFGGVVSISGPTILAIKGINAAFTAMNPTILGITAAIAGVALVTAAINKQAHAYEDLNSDLARVNTEAQGVISAFSKGDEKKKLDEATTQRLIALYPELATQIKAYKTEAGEAAKAVGELNEKKVLDEATKRIELLKKETEAIARNAVEYKNQAAGMELHTRLAKTSGDMSSLKRAEDALAVYKDSWDSAKNKAEKTTAQINDALAKIGKTLGENFQIIDLPVTITPVIPPPGGGGTDKLKKTWQEWFQEIADVSQTKFGDSGAKAGRLYVEGLEKALTLDQNLAEALGESFDISGALSSKQDEVRKTLSKLLSIDPSLIDKPFSMMDASTQALIVSFREAKTQLNGLNFTKTLTGLNNDIANLSKSERDLAEETYRANGFTEEQAKILADANAEFSRAEILNAYTVRLDEMGKSTEELARAKLVLLGATEQELRQFDEMVEKLSRGDGLRSFQEYFTDGTSQMLDSWFKLDKAINTTLSDMSYQLTNMSFDAALNGLNMMGQAFGDLSISEKEMNKIYAAMAQQILDNLPLMFLQAGLQLIANGQWGLGLGFIAAAGSSAFIAGWTKGSTNEADESTKNAHGNVYGEGGLHAFARGGTFTNQIVDSPTLFKFASGTGLMGEAGPEAIVPLRRLPNGDLGVQGESGGGAAPVVNIINNTGATVETRQSRRGGGIELDVIVGSIVDKNFSEGRHDDALGGRYGMTKRVRRG